LDEELFFKNRLSYVFGSIRYKGHNQFLKNINEKGFILGGGLMAHSSLEEHILNLEKRLMTYDCKDINDLLADDFLEFGSTGKSINKKTMLDAVLQGTTINSIRYTVTDFNIKLLSTDILLATYRTFRHNDSKLALRSEQK
jgi:hypothetical protein